MPQLIKTGSVCSEALDYGSALINTIKHDEGLDLEEIQINWFGVKSSLRDYWSYNILMAAIKGSGHKATRNKEYCRRQQDTYFELIYSLWIICQELTSFEWGTRESKLELQRYCLHVEIMFGRRLNLSFKLSLCVSNWHLPLSVKAILGDWSLTTWYHSHLLWLLPCPLSENMLLLIQTLRSVAIACNRISDDSSCSLNWLFWNKYTLLQAEVSLCITIDF